MARSSWPHGVTSYEDTVKFGELVFGRGCVFEDYSCRLPKQSADAFLLFVKGGCAKERPLARISDLIAEQLDEIQHFEVSERGNWSRPEKAILMLSNSGKVHYRSAQLSRAPCVCRCLFGADRHQKHLATTSSRWKAADKFSQLWSTTLQENYQCCKHPCALQWRGPADEPVWLSKTWHAVFNHQDHLQDHAIGMHADDCSTYSWMDPIVSLSYVRGGVLTVGLNDPKGNHIESSLIYQEPGDALIMSGTFQLHFAHGVPPRRAWPGLVARFGDVLQPWEKRGLAQELEDMKEAEGLGLSSGHIRRNCTVRWHHSHQQQCSLHQVPQLHEAINATGASGGQTPGQVPVKLTGYKEALLGSAAPASSSSAAKPPLRGAVQADDPGSVSASASLASSSVVTKPPVRGAVQLDEVTAKRSCGAEADAAFEQSKKARHCLQEIMNIVRKVPGHLQMYMYLVMTAPLCVPAAEESTQEQVLLSVQRSLLAVVGDLATATELYNEVMDLGQERQQDMDFAFLHLTILAAQQRGSIQGKLGRLKVGKGFPLHETFVQNDSNRLKEKGHLRKWEVTHRELGRMLDMVSSELFERCGELVVDMAQFEDPPRILCWKTGKKEKCEGFLGQDQFSLEEDSRLVLKCFDVGYVDQYNMRRLEIRADLMLQKLGGGAEDVLPLVRDVLKECLEHYRTLDYEKKHRCSAAVCPQECYSVFVWIATAVKHFGK